MDVLEQLTEVNLRALAAALRSGRLVAPFSPVSVQRFCGGGQAVPLAVQMQELVDDGMQPRHLATLVEAVLKTRTRREVAQPILDLVWTGPETPGITNRDTSVVVRELFGAAETEVLVVGFAVHQGRSVFQRLVQRMEEVSGLRVRFCLDVQRPRTDTSLASEIVHRFAHRLATQEWPGPQLPEIFYDPRSLDLETSKRSSMHAKCIVIDRKVAMVTSANFTEAAQTRNVEVGVLIRCPAFASQLAGHFESLATAGILRELPCSR